MNPRRQSPLLSCPVVPVIACLCICGRGHEGRVPVNTELYSLGPVHGFVGYKFL